MREPKSNGADRVVKVLRVFASGRVEAANPVGRPRGHAVPAESPTARTEPTEAPPAKVKDPKKVAAGKARAEKARKAKEAEAAAKVQAAAKSKAKPKTRKPEPSKSAKAAARLGEALGAVGKATKRGPRKGEPMTVVAFRVTEAHKKKLAKLGGADWMRDRIEKAALPSK